ncbi:MAG: hypothetical protein E3J72_17800 [Planctomycetota bacterium]|nr:MAG: hypothetical protein E3J72_17800 [Planctomycetota bacterium]
MADKIKFYNEGLWEGTEGQAYLKDQTLVNGSSDGNVIVRVIKGPISNPPAACKTSGGGFQITLCSGQLPRQGFLHELGHGWVGPFYSEEYNCLNASEGVCVMAMMVGLSGEGYSKWCDPTTCVESQQCWNLMQSTHGWAHPGPGGAAPACNVTIQ